MSVKENHALTAHRISDLLGCPLYQLNYIICSRGVRPLTKIGNCRVFSDEAFRQIEREVKRIRERRSNREEQ